MKQKQIARFLVDEKFLPTVQRSAWLSARATGADITFEEFKREVMRTPIAGGKVVDDNDWQIRGEHLDIRGQADIGLGSRRSGRQAGLERPGPEMCRLGDGDRRNPIAQLVACSSNGRSWGAATYAWLRDVDLAKDLRGVATGRRPENRATQHRSF